MPSDSYSFLDVVVLDEVRERFAAGDALVVLSTELDEVIWANGPGAALLGFPDIEAVLGAASGLGMGARRQIASTRGFPEIGRDRPVIVRLTSGVASQALALSASAISLPDGEGAILLASPASPGESSAEIARRAIGGFSEAGHFVALIDENGETGAASPGFEHLRIDAQSLADLAARTGGSRVAKQMLRCSAGQLPAGLARLTDDPARYLLVAIDERSAEERAAAEAAGQQQPEPAAAEPAEVFSPEAESGDLRSAAETPPDAATPETMPADVTQPAPAERAPIAMDEDLPQGAEAAERQAEAQAGHDTWYFSSDELGRREQVKTPQKEAEERPAPIWREAAPPIREPEALAVAEPSGMEFEVGVEAPRLSDAEAEAPSETEMAAGGATAKEAEAPAKQSLAATGVDRHAAPIRFVWRTDAQGRFSQISPEFAQAVAVEAAGIVGQRFPDLAASLGFDAAGEIAGLLERRDTWSGRSVLWPVAGTDIAIPVDLAALPVYGRDRNFEGFRGFGVARLGDAVVEPERQRPASPESALAEPAAGQPHPVSSTAKPAPPADPFRGETPALNIVRMPDRRSTDKIIRLAEHRPPATDRGALSSGERIAFQQIAERLKRDSAAARSAGSGSEPVPEVRSEAAAETKDAAPPQSPVPDKTEAGKPAEAISGAGDDLADLAALDGAEDAQPEEAAAESGHESPTAGPASDAGVSNSPARPSRKLPRPGMSLLDFAQWDRDGGPTAEQTEAAEPTGEPSTETPGFAENDIGQGVADAGEALPEPDSAAKMSAENEPAARGLEEPEFEDAADPQNASAKERAGIAILEKLPVPVLVHAGDTLHYANPEFLELTGYGSLEQLADTGGIGALFVDTYEDGDAPDRRDRQLRLTTAQGDEFPVEAFLQSAPWNGGKALLLVLRRTAETSFAAAPSPQLAELEARVAEMRTIIDTATDGVALIADDGTIRSISRPAEALFSFDSDEVAGKPFESLFAIESQRAVRDYLNGLADNGVASVLNDGREVIGREAQGRFLPLFMTIGKLPNDSGYCAVMRDITQWKRAEEDLTQARALAERASSQKTDFLARISHEIRTPLNAIIGFSELMIGEKFGPVTNDRYRDYLRDINRSGNHVLDLVNDLLDISKIEAGQQEMDFEAVSLNDTLAETVAMMQPQANRERVIIRSSFASGLPDVVADLRSVRQIALNILSNAVRYTQAGGQVIISTAYEPAGDVAIRVRDTGIGMTHAEIEQALKPFKQINSLKRGRGDGTGLGLPLTKAMVEANRARFTINSTPGEGTLVEISFPSTRVLAD